MFLCYVFKKACRQDDRICRTINCSEEAITLIRVAWCNKKFSSKTVIGQGGFGKVYRGTLRGCSDVAIKVLAQVILQLFCVVKYVMLLFYNDGQEIPVDMSPPTIFSPIMMSPPSRSRKYPLGQWR